MPDPVLLPPSQAHFEELAAHGAGETTKLLAVKPRLECTQCGGQHADLQPDWSQWSIGPVARSST